MKNNITLKDFYVTPQVPAGLEPVLEIAQNLWSTWNQDAYKLFSRIDSALFRKYNHNPLKLLHEVQSERLLELSQSSGFITELTSVYKKFQNYIKYEGYFLDENKQKQKFDPDFHIAYFSMEFGIHESLPIYSGGLGILSGDHLKASSDLAIPLTAFGLLYRFGYFNQKINLDGRQLEIYSENDWYSKPIEKVKDAEGNDLLIKIRLENEQLFLKVWLTKVGKVNLYLLDSNLKENPNHLRHITDHLYVSDRKTRLQQEIVLAYGGIELMEKLDFHPSVFHLNEGHSAFLILKRLQKLINEEKFSFEEAKNIVRASTVFTTHTPVPAGNEEFDSQLVKNFVEQDVLSFGYSFEEFSKFAKMPDNNNFSLSAFAIRFAKYINGVSILHSEVSREMWHSIYPNLYEEEFPISAITNGVHVQTWLSRQMTRIFDRYMGTGYQHMAENKDVWKIVKSVPDVEIWNAHNQRKSQLITFVRQRLQDSLSYRGVSAQKVNTVLNPDHLLIGFARRFASYKRGALILKDKQRLLKLLRNDKKPVQFIFAGKAHPADEKGKAVIKSLIDFGKENGLDHRFVFLENYDINVARHLVQGVDIWLNNPIKPMEASGTSGMKAAMNGAINLSVLDGWWPEAFNKQNGWSITAGDNISDPQIRDTLEANEIYELLENEIINLYYDQDKNGLPLSWIKFMKNSISDVGSDFNMHRVLREYLNNFYLPGAKYSLELKKDNFKELRNSQEILDKIKKYWDLVNFKSVQTNIRPNEKIQCGLELEINAEIYLDDAPENLFCVEVFYMKNNQNWEILPLKFIKTENGIAKYSLITKIIGSGKQGLNFRIKPTEYNQNKFEDFIKWYHQ